MLAPRAEVKIKHNDSISFLGKKQFAEKHQFATDKHWIHNYLPYYDKEINYLRRNCKNILEIGVYRGSSLLLWRDAFPGAKIYGVDKDNVKWRPFLEGQKDIEVLVGRQEDVKFLKEKVVPKGPFELIIDDGSHIPEGIRDSFNVLWDQLTPNGMYVIEDICGNYRPDRVMQKTSTELVKELMDKVHTNASIKSIHMYYNIIFIQKR